MTVALAPYVITALWFAACGATLFVLSRWYVASLLALSGYGHVLKVVSSAVLWLLFSVVSVMPLFGGIALATGNMPERLDWPAVVWQVLCYIVSLVPTYKSIYGKQLVALRAAGFFRE